MFYKALLKEFPHCFHESRVHITATDPYIYTSKIYQLGVIFKNYLENAYTDSVQQQNILSKFLQKMKPVH